MSTGLIALLDDIVALTKMAAVTLDDAAAQATKAGAKAAGIVIDDAAVTPRYAVGFAATRELPIVGKIAWGSLKNKLLFLLPAALLLKLFAPWAITPLLMVGGAYLCYEGFEKVLEMVMPHGETEVVSDPADTAPVDAAAVEAERVGGAIRTDFILSAEIMAIALSTITATSIWMQAMVLAVVGVGITILVYGAVALIVKADDVGLALAQSHRPVTGLGTVLRGRPTGLEMNGPTAIDRALSPLTRMVGRGLVKGMPHFLKGLSLVGTLAMLWVGGGIFVHGLAGYGWAGIEHAIHAVAVAVAAATPALKGAVEWLVSATGSGVVGLAIGGIAFLVMHFAVDPILGRGKHGVGGGKSAAH
ncbi:MAG: yedI [Xanthobacteraceae bacterium]|nr:MAG: yedI [Xanthobacteraceae bacterium]